VPIARLCGIRFNAASPGVALTSCARSLAGDCQLYSSSSQVRYFAMVERHHCLKYPLDTSR